MLVIAMHNNNEYLQHLLLLARAQGIDEVSVVRSKSLGFSLTGADVDITFSRSRLSSLYDKALVAVINQEEGVGRFLDAIEDDHYLNMINANDKGIVCTIPFKSVLSLKGISSKVS